MFAHGARVHESVEDRKGQGKRVRATRWPVRLTCYVVLAIGKTRGHECRAHQVGTESSHPSRQLAAGSHAELIAVGWRAGRSSQANAVTKLATKLETVKGRGQDNVFICIDLRE